MFSQATAYATSAMAFLAASGGKPSLVKVIAAACDAPTAYLAKIINVLGKKSLVQTQRGVGGGVSLARRSQDITLYDICVALDDPITQPRCMLGHAACTKDRACPAHEFCTTHRQRLTEFLQQTTVADIAAFETRRRWNRTSGQVGSSSS